MGTSAALDINDSHRSLTPDVINYLNNSLSKISISILKELYQNSQMQQKQLAASIHTSVTSLSNILSRLEDIQPQLLSSERVGRSKYYSLTEIAQAYVVQVILPQSNKIHKFSPLSQRDILISDALTLLYQFQDAAGSDWDLQLDNMLFSQPKVYAQEEATSAKENELFTLYIAFMDQMKYLKTSSTDTSVREVYDILNQPILIKRLELKLTEELTNYYILKPLFDLEGQNLTKSTKLIDNIFIEMAPDIFSPLYAYDTRSNTILPDELYNKLFREICIMKNDFTNSKYGHNKELITEHWQAKYFWKGYSLIYIAEKCAELFRQKQIVF